MTLKCYLYEPTLEGTAVITETGKDDKPWVRLSQTWFHPQGGGQKADRGKINDISVIHVAHMNGEIKHYVETLNGLIVGKKVRLNIDADWRQKNANLHTAGHLIAAIAENIFPDLKAISGHHWPEEARVEFTSNTLMSIDKVLSKLSDSINLSIEDRLAVKIIGNPLISREIQIGKFPAVPCGGTHLENLSLLNKVELTKIKVKNDKLRISYYSH